MANPRGLLTELSKLNHIFVRWRKMPIVGRVDKKLIPDPTRQLPHSLRHSQLHLVKAEGCGAWSNPAVAIENTIEQRIKAENETADPPKLFVVTLLQRKGRRPFYVTDALVTLGFEGIYKKKNIMKDRRDGHITVRYLHPKRPQHLHDPPNFIVVKNTPFYNRLLWLCKHIVDIKHITFPDGIPDASHLGCTRLNNFSGELRIIATRVGNQSEITKTRSELVDRSHVKSTLYRRYNRHDLGTEYFPMQVEYRYDLDKPGVIMQPKMYEEEDIEYL